MGAYSGTGALLKGWTFIRGNTVVTNARLPAAVQEVSPCSFSEQTVPSHEDRGVAVGIRKKLRKLSRISHAMLLQTKPSGEEKGGSREEKGKRERHGIRLLPQCMPIFFFSIFNIFH